MPTPLRSTRPLLLLVIGLALCSPALAEEKAPPVEEPAVAPGKARAPRAPAHGKQKLSHAMMLKTAREVTRGYYNALIAAKYDVAASFLHPSAIEPLRARVLADLEKSAPQKTENTLAALGVKDLTTLRTMSLDAFYVAWAKSSYGQGIQVLSQKDLAVDVVLEPPTCSEKDLACEVSLKLRGRKDDGTKMESPSTVWVVQHEGRWLLTLKPPA